jgi:hypothetical protein
VSKASYKSSASAGATADRQVPSSKEVIFTFVDWICNSSLDDAKSYIAQANEPTLRAAIARFEHRERENPRRTWKSYRRLIDVRLRRLTTKGDGA